MKSKGTRNGTKPTNLNPAVELLCKLVWLRDLSQRVRQDHDIPEHPDCFYAAGAWHGWADWIGWKSRPAEILATTIELSAEEAKYILRGLPEGPKPTGTLNGYLKFFTRKEVAK